MKRVIETIQAAIPFLEPYPFWVKVLVSGWVLFAPIVVLVLVLTPLKETRPGNTEDTSVQVGMRSTEKGRDVRIIIRQKNQVRPLRELEDELPLDKLPNGVFGFVSSGGIKPIYFEYIRLNRSGLERGYLEIHKLHDGTVVFLGYVSQESALRIETSKSDIDINLFTIKWEEARMLVGIPLTRVLSSERRRFRDGDVLDLRLRPAR